MPAWILYGLGAAFMLGAANIPQKIALGGLGQYMLSPFAYGMLSGVMIFCLNLLMFLYYKDDLQVFAKKEWAYAALAILMFAIGSIFIALGYRKGANISQFVALFNTNTLIATIMGLVLLKEAVHFTGVGVIKLVLGAIFVIVGGILVTV